MQKPIDVIKWNSDGLVPVVTQDVHSGRVLMLAWMNKAALEQTIAEKRAVYWSRSRQKLWLKGEQSGHRQYVKDIRIDCDADAILLKVEQQGGITCHTGRESCFYRGLRDAAWQVMDPQIKDPKDIYKK